MNPRSSTQSRRLGLRLASFARALPAVLALAALAVPTRSLAQAPTFNTLITTYKGDPGFAHPAWAAVGDFNGDGKLDSAVTDGTGTVHMLLGNGDGTFSERRIDVGAITAANAVGLAPSFTPFLPHAVDGVTRIRMADVNGDGKPDIIATFIVHLNFAPLGGVTVMINTGNDANGTPQFTTSAHYFAPNFDSRSLTVGDLNGDGRPDFVVGNANSPVWTWMNNGDGTFAFKSATAIQPSAGNPAVADGVIADVNGDGKADFIVTSGQSASTNIFLGNGDGTYQAPLVISGATSAVAVADLNKDGKLDLILNNGTGGVSVALGNGNGTFGTPVVYSTSVSGSVTSFDVADINGDGNLDVVAGVDLGVPGKVAVFLGDGSGSLGTPYVFDSTSKALAVVAADFTGDGKPDIGTVGLWDDTYGVLTNTTVFAPPLPTQTLTILGGNGSFGAVAANVEYYNPATNNWQATYLVGQHPWGEVAGTNSWINYRPSIFSDPGAGPTTNQTLWYLYRVRFTVPSDAINPHMTFSLKADNFAQVAINGVTTGGSTQFINNTNMNNVIDGQADQLNADAVFSQNVHPGENTITINVGDWGGANGFNFRIDLTMQSSQPLETLPAVPADTTPPVISVSSSSITKEATSAAGAVVTFTASATDAVSGSVPVTASPASGSTFPIGASSVSLTATDAAGNIAHAGIAVLVQDTTAPVVTAPANVVAEATSASGAAVTYGAASATDAVGVTSTTYSAASGSTFPLGTTTVTVTAKDAAGNKGTGSFTVTVQDTTAPVITSVPANITAEATSANGATVTYAAATATDAVGVSSITYSQNSGTTFPLGTTTVTVTAKDAAGNSSSKTFTVTVRDTTAPAIASVTPSSATLWPPNHQMVAITVNAVASDAVGVASLKIIRVTSSEPDNGLGDGDTPNDIQITGNLTVNLRAERAGGGNGRTYTITVEAKDAAGNASTKTCTVSVPKSQGGGGK